MHVIKVIFLSNIYCAHHIVPSHSTPSDTQKTSQTLHGQLWENQTAQAALVDYYLLFHFRLHLRTAGGNSDQHKGTWSVLLTVLPCAPTDVPHEWINTLGHPDAAELGAALQPAWSSCKGECHHGM